MKLSLLLLLPLFFLLQPHPASPDELSDLQEENLFLKAELKLARSNRLYVVVDLPEGAVYLKAGGVTARRLPVDAWRLHGPVPVFKERRIAARETDSPPRRPEIKIGPADEKNKPQTGSDSVNTLELDEMPVNFRLVLDDATALVVEPGEIGLGGTLHRAWGATRRTFALFYRKVRDQGPQTEILLTMPAMEARQFYWSLEENTAFLIRKPAGP